MYIKCLGNVYDVFVLEVTPLDYENQECQFQITLRILKAYIFSVSNVENEIAQLDRIGWE